LIKDKSRLEDCLVDRSVYKFKVPTFENIPPSTDLGISLDRIER